MGIYATNSPEACQYVAENCKANVLVVENNAQLQKILQVGIDMIELNESLSSWMKPRNLICNPNPLSKNWEFCKLGSVRLPSRGDIHVLNSWIMRFKLLCTGVTVLQQFSKSTMWLAQYPSPEAKVFIALVFHNRFGIDYQSWMLLFNTLVK